jgi:heme exporter protein A
MRLTGQGLEARRGERRIFGNLSFVVPQGNALVVTGPNGSGKSTLLKVIAGYIPAVSGTINLDGGDKEKPLGEYCQYLAHANALKPQMTVAENLRFWQGYLGAGEEVETALAAVGLPGIGDMPAAYLSAGQKRRVAIARLLVADRPVWLLDEPTAALDERSEKRFAAIVNAHLEKGGIVVAATHQALALTPALALDITSFAYGNPE